MAENALLSLQALRPGTSVEVRSSFDRDWKRGFLVEKVESGGYRLRRRSDDSVLPTIFAFNVVREAPDMPARTW